MQRRPHLACLTAALLLGVCLRGAWAQAALEPAAAGLAERIAAAAATGDERSVRDLMTLVDSDAHGAYARATLSRLLIDGQAPDPATAARQPLLDFYYAHSDSLSFSPLLGGYYVRALERQDCRYELRALDEYQLSDRSMHLRKYIAYAEQAIRFGSRADLVSLAEKIVDLELVEGHAYLLRLLAGEGGELLAADLDDLLAFVDEAMARPSVELAEALFGLEARGYLRHGTLAHYLSRLCNAPFRASWSTDEHRGRYARLLDSLGSLARVREFGYRASISFVREHFRDPVDYYGRILATPGLEGYVYHNALLDLTRSQHPRALFYLASQVRRALEDPEGAAHPAAYYLYTLRRLTGLDVAVEDASGRLVSDLVVLGDRIARLNYVRYWARRYEDYDYDEHRGSFVNRHDRSLETENLERLFRLLNSDNDEVALQAYRRLTVADPLEVQQLVAKYKDLLRSTNPRVPPLKDGHLEHTAQLVAYCRRNRVEVDPGPTLSRALDSLLLPLQPRARVQLENRLIARLALDELTGVEYWGALHQFDLDASYSVGRILDYAYSRHWSAMTSDAQALRLYLKKASLFARMDGIGVSDSYARKFVDVGAATRLTLEQLLRSETDPQVQRLARRLLRGEAAADRASELSVLDDFLENPTRFTRGEVATLPPPTLEQLSELLWRQAQGPGAKARYLYAQYIDGQLSTDRVPDLLSLIIRGEAPEAVAELLSRVYHYRFPGVPKSEAPDRWLLEWQERSDTYRKWGRRFYAEQLAALATAERVSGADLNAVLRSPYYDAADRERVVDALPRLASNRHLFMLKFDPPLAWSERGILSGLELTYKDLQDLDKIFPTVPPAELVDYVVQESRDFGVEDRGRLFNAIMRKPWVEELLDDADFGQHAETVSAALEAYLEESAFLSEYEEQNTALNLARLRFIGRTVTERLHMSVALDVDPAAKLRIQEAILARVAYADLPEVIRLWPELTEVNGKRPYNFLSRDFGLPIFDLDDLRVADTLAGRHARLSERELYRAYLLDFGLAIELPGGSLDYDAVAEILRYDIVSPFFGGGGNRRDLYTYGVIKLLELTEGTRLGYHEKLNEDQLFYSYSASKRAGDWLDYLTERGLLASPQGEHPSFNATSAK